MWAVSLVGFMVGSGGKDGVLMALPSPVFTVSLLVPPLYIE